MHVWLLPTVTLNAVPTEPEEDLGSAEIDEASQRKKLKNWRHALKGRSTVRSSNCGSLRNRHPTETGADDR
jgi:hypothetical protein